MNIKIPIILSVLLLVVGILMGKWFGLHSFDHFDTVLHFIGGFLIAWLALSILGKKINSYSKAGAIILVIILVLTVGIVWEIAEHISGRYGQEYFPLIYGYFHGGDPKDTMIDLVADSVGGLLFIIAWMIIKKPKFNN